MRSSLLVLSLLFAGCAGGSQAGPAPAPASALRPEDRSPFPRDLPGFDFTDSTAYENPNMGVSYGYSGPGDFQATAYLFPAPPVGALCHEACAIAVADAQVEDYQATVPLMVERGYFDSIADIQVMPVHPPQGAWVAEGRHLAFTLYNGDGTFDSHLIAFSGLEQVVKVRATWPAGAVADSVLDRFVSALLRDTPAPYTCARGNYEGEGVVVSTRSAGAADSIIAAVDQAFLSSGYDLAFREPESGRWRTAPRFAWPDSADALVDRNAGMVLAGVLKALGDSIEVNFVASPACRPKSRKDGGAFAVLESLKLANAYNENMKAGVRP